MSFQRRLLSSMTGAALAVAAMASPALAEPHRPHLSVLNSSTLQVAGGQGKDAATGYFSVLNPGQTRVRISVRFQAASSEKVRVSDVTPHSLRPSGATRLGITFSGLDGLSDSVTGQLVIGGGAEPVSQGVEVDPAPQPSLPWPEVLVIGSFWIAVLLALGVVGNMPRNERRSLRNHAPGPKWALDSWATTLTSAGAVFGTVLSSATLPSFPKEIDKQTLVNLNILFGILVVLGPFIFQSLRRPGLKPTDPDADLWGWNSTLLIACAVTLWAVIGQLGAFGLLTWELIGGGIVGWLVIAGLVLVGSLAAYYFWTTASMLVITDWSAPSAPAGAPPPAEIDVADLEKVFLRPSFAMATVQRQPEAGRAEISLHPPLQPPRRHWSLL